MNNHINPLFASILDNAIIKPIQVYKVQTHLFACERLANSFCPEADPCTADEADVKVILISDYFGRKKQKSFYFKY